jgi:hypothetical protein
MISFLHLHSSARGVRAIVENERNHDFCVLYSLLDYQKLLSQLLPSDRLGL